MKTIATKIKNTKMYEFVIYILEKNYLSKGTRHHHHNTHPRQIHQLIVQN